LMCPPILPARPVKRRSISVPSSGEVAIYFSGMWRSHHSYVLHLGVPGQSLPCRDLRRKLGSRSGTRSVGNPLRTGQGAQDAKDWLNRYSRRDCDEPPWWDCTPASRSDRTSCSAIRRALGTAHPLA
jgi:hypothetical protein